MGQEDRLRHRRLLLPLRLAERRAPAPLLAPHHLPELLEVVQHRHAFQPLLEIGGEVFVGGVHVAELGCPERPAIALRNPDAIEHVGERDRPAVRHVRVPALARVRHADRLAVLHDVGKYHYLGNARFLVGVGDVDFQVPEARAEVPEVGGGKLLPRKTDDAVLAQRMQNRIELHTGQRLCEVEPLHRRAECLSAGFHFQHRSLLEQPNPISHGNTRKSRKRSEVKPQIPAPGRLKFVVKPPSGRLPSRVDSAVEFRVLPCDSVANRYFGVILHPSSLSPRACRVP